MGFCLGKHLYGGGNCVGEANSSTDITLDANVAHAQTVERSNTTLR